MSYKKIKISLDDLKYIYEDDFSEFEQMTSTCYCSNCQTGTFATIINYDIFIDDLDDVVLAGFCSKCGHKIGRRIETGEVEKFRQKIKNFCSCTNQLRYKECS